MFTTLNLDSRSSRLDTTLAQPSRLVKSLPQKLSRQEDRDLVEAFVEATREMSAHDAAREIGLSHETVARWRRGQWKRLYPGTRRAIARYLEQRRHEDAAASGAESLLRSKAALYRTLTDMGGDRKSTRLNSSHVKIS